MVTFEEFMSARLPALLRYAAALAGDREVAQDVVQDALVRAHARWRRIGGMEQPERYLQRMITNEFLSWRRRVVRRARLFGRFAERPAVTEDHAGPYAERSALWPRLATLPPRYRAVLVLRYYEDLTDAEIAGMLACSPGSVRVYRARALAALREDLPDRAALEEIP